MLTLAQLRTLFLRANGLGSGDLDETSVIDVYLNKIWQTEIPNKIGSEASDSYVDFNLAVGDDDYGYDEVQADGRIRSLTGPVLVDGSQVDIYTDPKEFYGVYETATNDTPDAVLLYDRTMVFRPIPTAILAVRAYGNFYRAALPSADIPIDEGWCAVRGAVYNYAHDVGDADTASRFQPLYEMSLAEIAAKYASGKRVPIPPGDVW